MKKLFLGLLIGAMIFGGIALANKITDDNAFLPQDAKGEVVQVPAGFLTQDATGTPQTSPLTVSNTKITIAVPDGVAELIIVHTDQAIRVSELSAMTRYFMMPANYSVVVPVADTDFVYLIRDGSSDATVQFFFNVLEN